MTKIGNNTYFYSGPKSKADQELEEDEEDEEMEEEGDEGPEEPQDEEDDTMEHEEQPDDSLVEVMSQNVCVWSECMVIIFLDCWSKTCQSKEETAG